MSEKNLTAGEILKNARLKSRRSRELPTIAKKLCIREEYLSGLEDGDYSKFPETIYIVGFARNYAMELGLDPDEIVDMIKKELGITKSPEDTIVKDELAAEEEIEKKDVSLFDLNVRDWKKFNFGKKYILPLFKNKKYLTIFISFLFCLILSIWIISAFVGNSDVLKDSESSQNESVLNALTAPSFSMPVKNEYGSENKSESDFAIQATEETWVKLEGKKSRDVLFSRVLMPGDVYYAPKESTNLLTVGDASGITIYLHGQAMPPIGGKNVRLSQIPLIPETFAINNNSKEQ